MAARADPRQLGLDLPARPALGREAFLVSPCNDVALAQIDAWRDWPTRKLVLTGPPGSGKTHLAHIWAAEAEARVLAAPDLASATPAEVAPGNLAVEDADRIAGDAEAERMLFHLHNMVLESGGSLLLTAREAPARWGVRLPDLASRIGAAGLAGLNAPDDDLLRAVLVKLFADCQQAVSPRLVDYLATHMDRSFAAARRIVARLDGLALASRSRITREMARRLLEEDHATRA
ncbi:P-loop NTPase family protein [Roseitranquillus sediminis]|uniref:DnaA/Hda family protein n=1 Tax=Roseitranquillus sediminis TaxID=2809051 RepID=UPI001D0C4229|nr:DnaA/Hda family protein [Roseitranquillus sediminis]MBM9595761.1 chromosomal replication initiator DnaA [Roseitranquillus sediminis]